MLQSFDYRNPRYGMIAVAILYFLLLVLTILIGNPFIRWIAHPISWLSMLVFLIMATVMHPLHRKWMAIPYIISQIAAVVIIYTNISQIIEFRAFSLSLMMMNLILYGFTLLAMILPLFIFLRKDIYQRPFIILASVALAFQLISQSWYILFLLANLDFGFFAVNSIRVLLSLIPYISIILYAWDAKYIQRTLFPNYKESSDDDELFGWLTLGIYTIYLAITKPYYK